MKSFTASKNHLCVTRIQGDKFTKLQLFPQGCLVGFSTVKKLLSLLLAYILFVLGLFKSSQKADLGYFSYCMYWENPPTDKRVPKAPLLHYTDFFTLHKGVREGVKVSLIIFITGLSLYS